MSLAPTKFAEGMYAGRSALDASALDAATSVQVGKCALFLALKYAHEMWILNAPEVAWVLVEEEVPEIPPPPVVQVLLLCEDVQQLESATKPGFEEFQFRHV
jgi:hypothetical protein